jgi:CubicO group peptidase (beta-lactamase class C family)
MNKMFTGVAIAQLARQGKLSFDDKVGDHLPDYPNHDVRDKVSIHHLLTHTAGLGLYWKELLTSPGWAYLHSVQDYDNLTNEKPLLFEPGERFSYSNCGPIVLGLIIEKLSDMSYDDYIRQNVTGPAGMINTDCYDIKQPILNMAIGYTKRGFYGELLDNWTPNWYLNPPKGGPAGGGYSTVEDLLRFDVALRNHKLLNKELLDILTTGKVDRNETTRYAYLFEEKVVNGQRIIGHSGSAAGVSATLAMHMTSGYTVAIMSNYDRGVRYLRANIEKLLTKE